MKKIIIELTERETKDARNALAKEHKRLNSNLTEGNINPDSTYSDPYAKEYLINNIVNIEKVFEKMGKSLNKDLK